MGAHSPRSTHPAGPRALTHDLQAHVLAQLFADLRRLKRQLPRRHQDDGQDGPDLGVALLVHDGLGVNLFQHGDREGRRLARPVLRDERDARDGPGSGARRAARARRPAGTLARARMSRPVSAIGMDSSWMGDGFSKPFS